MVGTIKALEQTRRMRGGSQSHLMRCSDGHYYVVKFQNNPQHRRILANEFIATALATCLGLPTTNFAIIDVAEKLIELTPEMTVELPTGQIPCSHGRQFGSRLPCDPTNSFIIDVMADDHLLYSENVGDLLGMFVFDKWICNADGRQTIFTGSKNMYKMWMIDQGFAFNAGEWNFPDSAVRGLYCRRHVYQAVQGLDSFEPWLRRLLDEIDLALIHAIAIAVPPEWYEADFLALEKLVTALDRRRTMMPELIERAARSLPNVFPNWRRPKLYVL
jgi:HipA-like kinase